MPSLRPPLATANPAAPPQQRKWMMLGRATTAPGVVLATGLALFFTSFASDQTLAQPALCQAQYSATDPLIYVGGTVILTLLFWIAARLVPGHTRRRGVAVWLMSVASAGVVLFAGVAILSLGFWTSARDAASAEAVIAGIVFIVGFTTPSIAALIASILVLRSGRRAMSPVLPPAVFVGVVAVSAGIIAVVSTVPCI